MQELIQKAGLTPAILKDPDKRAAAIDEYNAKAGGLRGLMRRDKLELAPTHTIPPGLPAEELGRFLRYAVTGKRAPIIFAAGRATRMKLPPLFDRLGIAGLTPRILSLVHSMREVSDAPAEKLLASAPLNAAVETAVKGGSKNPLDLSFLQRQLLQYHYQMKKMVSENPAVRASFGDWLANASFAVVANDANKAALAEQLATIGFGGLKTDRVFVLVQPECGGLEVLPNGSTVDYQKDVWPEGHGKPFLDMRSDARAAFRVDARGGLAPLGKTLYDVLRKLKVDRVVFAQVNDLHLLEDMVHAERWAASDALFKEGVEMTMEVVANGLRQKGGGVFLAPDGNTVMRDTIAMKTKDLEPYSYPQSLSRMFYEITLAGIGRLMPDVLPAYMTERKTPSGKTVLTREYYSGDASSVLRSAAIQRNGYELSTFKMQARIPETLEIFQKQDRQPDFLHLI